MLVPEMTAQDDELVIVSVEGKVNLIEPVAVKVSVVVTMNLQEVMVLTVAMVAVVLPDSDPATAVKDW